MEKRSTAAMASRRSSLDDTAMAALANFFMARKTSPNLGHAANPKARRPGAAALQGEVAEH